MSTTLLSLVSASHEVTKQLLEAGGEITPEIESQMAIIDVSLPEKVEHYVYTLEELASREAYFKSKAEYFAQIAKSFEHAQEFMEERLKFAAKELGVKELAGTDHKISIIPSKSSVVIEDESKIDQLYIREKVTKSVDKTKVGEDLRLGIPVPGAKLQEGSHVKISANRKALK